MVDHERKLEEEVARAIDGPETSAMTVRGLRNTVRAAMEMKTATRRGRAEAALRRAIVFLVREASMHLHTFAVLRFVHEVTRPELLADVRYGQREMERLSETTPSDVPLVYYALAGDVFEYVARKLEAADRWEAKHGQEVPEPPDLRAEGLAVSRAAGHET